MEGLYASRWAATPSPEMKLPPKDAKRASVSNVEYKPLPAPPDEDDELVQKEADRRSAENDAAANSKPVLRVESEPPATIAAESVQTPRESVFLQPPRLRKRVSWRGKNVVISIPKIDHEAMRIAKPMSQKEINERLKQFEKAGYDTQGFTMAADDGQGDGPVQAKQIFPSDEEGRSRPSGEQARVVLPDLNRWKAYMNALTEAKLAALGVSMGGDEPPLPPQQLPGPAQDMSRQSSGPYPALPFSPPITTGSAGSIGRPQMMRSHSHTMSMASPASPLNGPFSHMHRHSNFSGPMGFPQQQLPHQPQQPPQQMGIPSMQHFSPQKQFAFPEMPRITSPAHMGGLGQDLGNVRGPSSPLSQHMLVHSPQDHSKNLMQDQRNRRHGYSQSVQQMPVQMPVPNNFLPQQKPSVQQTPVLPELPEDEEEDGKAQEQSEQSAYVHPHTRASLHADIAVPTPRGHRHNISEGLEREILETEQGLEDDANAETGSASSDKGEINSLNADAHEGILAKPQPAQTYVHDHKSASRFNVAAPVFAFNPGALFQPSQTTFTFGVPAPTGHNRKPPSGTFNVAAPTFKPSSGSALPSSDFSFSMNGPVYQPNAPSFKTPKHRERNVVDELPSIFGMVDIPHIVKPAKKSKAIAIVRPDEMTRKDLGPGSEYEDDEGRIARSDERPKRQRFGGDDGDSVPQFAEPTPVPSVPSNPINVMPEEEEIPTHAVDANIESVTDQIGSETDRALNEIAARGVETVEDAIKRAEEETAELPELMRPDPRHGHKPSSSLSALAKPFEPPCLQPAAGQNENNRRRKFASISELEEGELREDVPPPASPPRSQEPSSDEHPQQQPLHVPQRSFYFPASERIGEVAQMDPSFDEIDAVLRQLNDADVVSEVQGHDVGISPLPSPGLPQPDGVTYLPQWARSDAPSPSPKRQPAPYHNHADSSFTIHDRTDSGEPATNAWPHVHRLNKAEDVPTSDWSGVLSPPDEEKLQHRSNFFDSHIDDLIGRVVERRLQPLEESLRSIYSTVNKRTRSADLLPQHRSSSVIESDADDEDELSDQQRQRPISRGRDQKLGQIKAVVLEALRELSPRRSQSAYDIADLHSALADMKVSFARAASASLELDDIRAVVEDVMGRQSQAIVPMAIEEGMDIHRRQVSELENRLNETLAATLEDANHRHAVEEREAETRRMLRLAEEELHVLRNSSRDDGSRVCALEDERHEMLRRVEVAEEAQQRAEAQLRSVEAENEALQGTLDEYRLSSTNWRHEIDEGKEEREGLQNTISVLERHVEETEKSGSGMRRRLEKLHSDMATAAGQLTSEKASWKSREEDYRAKIDALETQRALFVRERAQLEDEIRTLRSGALEPAEAKLAVEHLRTSNASLHEMVRKLQTDLAEQQSFAARFERESIDAREAGRAEVHSTRVSMETDIAAANHQVNVVRAELESELSRVRADLDNVRLEADTAKARHELLLEEETDTRREALRKATHANSVALDEARQKHAAALLELQAQHNRSLQHAVEDKQRSEYILNERLALSDAKVQHFHDRVLHLEDRLEVAKSAAQAAVMSAQSSKAAPQTPRATGIIEKVSPQALRESILVLQEQLQEREARIDRLQNEVDSEGPAKLKERDTEIAWLRELLSVRGEELTDLVNTLSKPTFDRDAVRDTAIRIRANLQMEQQEKERFGYGGPALSGQAIASLSSFATPKAVQLVSGFNKWRTSMESTSLKGRVPSSMPQRSSTPSKAASAPKPPSYLNGLMTPPASNLRSSPSPEAKTSLPPPRLQSRSSARSTNVSQAHGKQPLLPTEAPSTPTLFREQSYDKDAEEGDAHPSGYEDDDLDVADSEPPAFRSLEAELQPANTAE